MQSELKKKNYVDFGSNGLPSDYPVPPNDPNLLFYIQRNQNSDTIVYQLNRNLDGLVNLTLPMHAYWIKYSENGIVQELNDLQNQLAYGYKSDWISHDLIRFSFVAYPQLVFFITQSDRSRHHVITNFEGKQVIIDHIYVYAHEFGVFPDVRFIEFFGRTLETHIPFYNKITIE